MKIECDTCKHNGNCYNSPRCLVSSPGKIWKTVNGERLYSFYDYHYFLWESMKDLKLKFRVGQKVKIKRYQVRPRHWNPDGYMDKEMGKEVIISSISNKNNIFVVENVWCWQETDFILLNGSKNYLPESLFEI